MFHVPMLRKYIVDLTHVIDCKPLEIEENLSYQEKPIKILAREVKVLRNRNIGFIKVLWRNYKSRKLRENERRK